MNNKSKWWRIGGFDWEQFSLLKLEPFCRMRIITMRHQLVKWPSSCVAWNFNTGWPFPENQPVCVSLELPDDCCVDDRPARSRAEMEMALCYLSGFFFFFFSSSLVLSSLVQSLSGLGPEWRLRRRQREFQQSFFFFCCCLDFASGQRFHVQPHWLNASSACGESVR